MHEEVFVSDVRDVIIIGGGPAGLSAGLYTSREGLSTLVLEKRSGTTLMFRLAAADPHAAARERLIGYTAFERTDLAGIPFARASADGISGVYAYNSLLFRLAGGIERKGSMLSRGGMKRRQKSEKRTEPVETMLNIGRM